MARTRSQIKAAGRPKRSQASQPKRSQARPARKAKKKEPSQASQPKRSQTSPPKNKKEPSQEGQPKRSQDSQPKKTKDPSQESQAKGAQDSQPKSMKEPSQESQPKRSQVSQPKDTNEPSQESQPKSSEDSEPENTDEPSQESQPESSGDSEPEDTKQPPQPFGKQMPTSMPYGMQIFAMPFGPFGPMPDANNAPKGRIKSSDEKTFDMLMRVNEPPTKRAPCKRAKKAKPKSNQQKMFGRAMPPPNNFCMAPMPFGFPNMVPPMAMQMPMPMQFPGPMGFPVPMQFQRPFLQRRFPMPMFQNPINLPKNTPAKLPNNMKRHLAQILTTEERKAKRPREGRALTAEERMDAMVTMGEIAKVTGGKLSDGTFGYLASRIKVAKSTIRDLWEEEKAFIVELGETIQELANADEQDTGLDTNAPANTPATPQKATAVSEPVTAQEDNQGLDGKATAAPMPIAHAQTKGEGELQQSHAGPKPNDSSGDNDADKDALGKDEVPEPKELDSTQIAEELAPASPTFEDDDKPLMMIEELLKEDMEMHVEQQLQLESTHPLGVASPAPPTPKGKCKPKDALPGREDEPQEDTEIQSPQQKQQLVSTQTTAPSPKEKCKTKDDLTGKVDEVHEDVEMQAPQQKQQLVSTQTTAPSPKEKCKTKDDLTGREDEVQEDVEMQVPQQKQVASTQAAIEKVPASPPPREKCKPKDDHIGSKDEVQEDAEMQEPQEKQQVVSTAATAVKTPKATLNRKRTRSGWGTVVTWLKKRKGLRSSK